MRNESDEKQQDIEEEEEESKLTENDASSVEQVDHYEGPIARSRTKRMENALLIKANTLLSNHFNN